MAGGSFAPGKSSVTAPESKNQVIRADNLARTMVDVAVRGTGEARTLVLENRDIRRLAGVVTERETSL